MKILLTNDDGFDAPGLAALKASILYFGQTTGIADLQIWTVAPDRGRSECGHSVTTGRDLRLCQYEPNWFSLDGTPVDCVRVALSQICPDVDMVFSGINAGANVGIDLLVSGTFAAAREAVIHNKPAMAISHYRRPDVPKTWDHTPNWLLEPFGRFTEEFKRREVSRETTTDVWNVNLPAIAVDSSSLPPIHECPVDPSPLKRDASLSAAASVQETSDALQNHQNEWSVALRSEFHGRPRLKGTDIDRCFSGGLTISKVPAGIT